ncbi:MULTISPECIES: substrate-binding periplasmic protein [Thalassospira]|jgi:ABC-type amino acid transport substrate-binding protein|uniref:Solute-binding protein family 3/N-terminal domain-containing protein n=2 Tax=Thalassospiraceae TaxID=2844866 RepID=A0ABR5Y6R8_9PROT|nr:MULTISPECIES: transporter substrate-binding domain-containing protein [Thalassospira]MAL28113.1 hypothetical protein [Thalassospira sp.]OCK08514.1 ABC-type transporter, periplasmic subunit family 3 [Thalassospira sp. KO164]SEE49972.1 extracellular solute-binding protein, family 3 [Thalassospira permensis]KZD06889.1 hypothetical protein AUP40_08675 [Thalassospira xiamenensis]KZD09177.1 hypothetical protein AUP45_14350 [Thalassospira xiamenensis]|tara:strand:+ start:1663 stop:2679 length:1017 start_codon:yes stop_codon:yes gene_type:complete
MARIGKLRAPIWLPLALAGDPEMKNRVHLTSHILSVWQSIRPSLFRMACAGLVIAVAITGFGAGAKASDGHPDVAPDAANATSADDLQLTVLADQEFYPQSYQLNGHANGALYDLLRDFSKLQQIDMSFQQLPLKRALENSGNNRAGFIGIPGNTASNTVIFSDGISTTSLLALTLKQRDLNITTAADLDGLQVSIARGLELHGPLARHLREGRFDISRFNSIRQSIALLLAGRVDVALIYCGYAQKASLKQIAHLTDDEIAALSIHPTSLMNTINRLILPATPGNARLMRHFNSYLARQRSSGALEKLYAQYLTNENTIEMVLSDTLTPSDTKTSTP